MKKAEEEKTKHFSPPSCRLNGNNTQREVQFMAAPSWALGGPVSSVCCRKGSGEPALPWGLAAQLTGSQGLQGCLNITPQLCFSPLVTRSKRDHGLEGDCSHSPNPSMAL